jgi:hypothetical protein
MLLSPCASWRVGLEEGWELIERCSLVQRRLLNAVARDIDRSGACRDAGR